MSPGLFQGMSVCWAFLSLCLTLNEAASPVFNNVPVDINVAENENTNRLLYILDVTDADGDNVVCVNEVDSSNNGDNGNEFTLARNPTTGRYELDVAAGADFTGKPFDMIYWNRIRCNDGGTTATATVYVHVVPGQDISWSFGVNTPADAMGTAAGDTVYTATATNTLNHDFIYELVDVSSSPGLPGSDPFFQINAATGEILALQNLERISTDISQIYLTIKASEEELSTYATVILDMTNQNTRPSTTVLDLTETQPESITAGTTLFTLTIDDPDPQTHTIKWRCDPTIGNTIFTLNGNNFQLATGQTLNYETNDYYECTFVINDGIHDSDTYTYQLNVGNANDPPEFSTSKYYATMAEGTAGSTSVNPGLTCTDEDSVAGVEPLTYAVKTSAYSNMFTLSSSGMLTFAQDFDLDAGSMPSSLTLTIACLDDEGASATAQLLVTITDKNDNAPVVPSSAIMYSDNLMTPGQSIIGTLTPTDADSGSNADVTCSGTSSSAFSSYYYVTTTCQVILAKTIDFDFGTVAQYLVYAVDHGSPKLTGTTTLDVIYREILTTSTTTTVATTTPYNFWDHPENIALTVLAALLCLSLMGLLTYCCIRYCWGRNLFSNCYRRCKDTCCQRRYPERPPTPITPPRTPTPPPREKTPIIIRDPTPPPRVIKAVPKPVIVKVTRTVAQPGMIPGIRPVGPAGTGIALRPPPPYGP